MNAGKRLSLWGPVFLYTGLIFWLSSQVRPIPLMRYFAQMDKVCHFAEFLPYGALWLRAVQRRSCGWALLGAAAVALLDEYYQSFVPMKVMTFGDWLADAGGAAVGIGLYSIWRKARTP